jgi:hypothetical protein
LPWDHLVFVATLNILIIIEDNPNSQSVIQPQDTKSAHGVPAAFLALKPVEIWSNRAYWNAGSELHDLYTGVKDSENRDKIAMIKHSPVRGMHLLPESLFVRSKPDISEAAEDSTRSIETIIPS